MNPIPMAVLQELRCGHERFLAGLSRHPHSSRERMLEVEGAQHPIAAVLGCADSRVPVEMLFDTGFGDLFVVRNAGTMNTTAAIASLEYAVAHLGVVTVQWTGRPPGRRQRPSTGRGASWLRSLRRGAPRLIQDKSSPVNYRTQC
jgi:hypothetical protein